MIDQNKLDDLCQILERMTSAARTQDGFRPSRTLRRIENFVGAVCLVSLMLLISASAWIRFFDAQDKYPGLLIGIALFALLWATVCIAVMLFGFAQAVLQHWKEPYSVILSNLRNELPEDVSAVQRLLAFDKPTLELGLLRYRHCWEAFDNRFAAVIGDIRKLGMLPALAALSVAVATLLGQDANLPAWATLIVASSLYMFALYTLGRREQPQKVIRLLEYAISYAQDETASKPAARIVSRAS